MSIADNTGTEFDAPPQIRRVGPLARAHLWIAAEYAPALAQAGLGDFDTIISTSRGRLLRRLADRENRHFELHVNQTCIGDQTCPGDQTGPRGMYLKTHRIRSWRGWLRAKLGAGLGPNRAATPGAVEAVNIVRLQRLGVDTMPLVAYGQRLHRDGATESFVLTEELAGFTQLDYFLRQRFSVGRSNARRDRELYALIKSVADVAARFHGLGFNHRDFYCCHFFIRESVRGKFAVHLIDLQRVEHRRWLRRRWLVKDLGQLAYSAPRERISRTDRMAFIKRYLGVTKLRPRDKRLIRSVLAKQRSLERRHGEHA
jgi:hypothetical protein